MVTMVQSPVMGYRTGAATRRRILGALLEREPRTVRGLALACDHDVGSMFRFVRRMVRDGLLTVTVQHGRRGSAVTLTAAGRAMASDLSALTNQEPPDA